MTQAQKLHTHLRRRAMTYMEMLSLGISTCVHKRLAEGMHYLKPGEKLVKGERKGLRTYRVTKAG